MINFQNWNLLKVRIDIFQEHMVGSTAGTISAYLGNPSNRCGDEDQSEDVDKTKNRVAKCQFFYTEQYI